MRYEYTFDPRLLAPRPGTPLPGARHEDERWLLERAEAEMRGQIIAEFGGAGEITPQMITAMDDALFHDVLRRVMARVSAVAEAVGATLAGVTGVVTLEQGHRHVAELVAARLAAASTPTLASLAAQCEALLRVGVVVAEQGGAAAMLTTSVLYVRLLVHARSYVEAAAAIFAAAQYDRAELTLPLHAAYDTLAACAELYPSLASLIETVATRAAARLVLGLGSGSGAVAADTTTLRVLKNYVATTDRMQMNAEGAAFGATADALRAHIDTVASATSRAVAVRACAVYTTAAVDIARAPDPWQAAMQSVSFVMQPPPASGPVRRIGSPDIVGHGSYCTTAVRTLAAELARHDAWAEEELGGEAARHAKAAARRALDAGLAATLRAVDNPDEATRAWITHETHSLARLLGVDATKEVARFADDTLCVNLAALMRAAAAASEAVRVSGPRAAAASGGPATSPRHSANVCEPLA